MNGKDKNKDKDQTLNSIIDQDELSYTSEDDKSHDCSDLDDEDNEQSMLTNEDSIDGVQFNKSQILSPTCISINMNTPFSEYRKARIYDLEVQCEPLQLSLDYTDLDLIYYLNKRYEFTIAPAYAHYNAPYDFMPEEVDYDKEDNFDSKKSDQDSEE